MNKFIIALILLTLITNIIREIIVIATISFFAIMATGTLILQLL